MKKSCYIDLMENALAAYSIEHIDDYFNRVKKEGMTEHGFPRLTANIGILLAHGRRSDLLGRFIEMTEFCCQQFLKVKADNDFSVKEIIFCMQELEKSDIISSDKLEHWKDLLKQINPYTCYKCYAKTPECNMHNWAAFTMMSEFMRQIYGLTDEYADFIDLQAYSQLRHLDSNKMYRDPNNPMIYDFVTRGLFALLLDLGYQGKYRKVWEESLEASAIPTLEMLSVTGETPFGGRSDQFINNNAHAAILFEYYAKIFARKGDIITAGKFKAAVERTIENTLFWLNQKPISHIKNKFPIDSQYGCECYAYFDKYMITVASFFYVAYRICDDSIAVGKLDDRTGMAWLTSDDFHKVFLRAGEYSAEYECNADFLFDCNGMGRLHKKGAPSEICLSAPCPAKPYYTVDIENPSNLAISPAFCKNGSYLYATEKNVRHTVKAHTAKNESASTDIECVFPDGETIKCHYHLDKNGLTAEFKGENSLRCLLPVFRFNGREYTQVTFKENILEIEFQGYICRYTVFNGTITDLQKPARNRNGYYDSFAADGSKNLKIQISVEKKS